MRLLVSFSMVVAALGAFLASRAASGPPITGIQAATATACSARSAPATSPISVSKWTFPISAASERALQVTPVVVGGVMYVTAPNEAVALDARTGRQLWRYTRPRTKGVIGDAGSGINRGVATLGDRVFMVTDHAHLIALDRLTGSCYGTPRWPISASTTARRARRWSLAISWSPASRAATRGFAAFSTLTEPRPASAPGGSGRFRRAVNPDRRHGAARRSSTAAARRGSPAPTIPKRDCSTGPPATPAPITTATSGKATTSTNSVVALDPQAERCSGTTSSRRTICTTGTRRKHGAHRRHVPRPAAKLLVQGNRNGFFYVLDRLTGELLMAEPFVEHLTWANGIGPDGRPKLLPDRVPTPEGTRVCPAVAGATNWPSTAFNPATGLYYLMAQESCAIYSKNDEWWKPGASFYGGTTSAPCGGWRQVPSRARSPPERLPGSAC